MIYVIGIDGGATRTLGAVANQEGHILAQVKAGPSNYHAVGEGEAIEQIRRVILQLMDEVCLEPEDISAICLGLAGVARPRDQEIMLKPVMEIGLENKALLTSDVVIAFAGGTLSDAGVIVISGTGSVVLARGLDGKTKRVGGWGHLLADEGSGYDIGLKALRGVMRAYDGRGESTDLTLAILKHLDLEVEEGLVDLASGGHLDKTVIAELAQEVFAAAANEDDLACEIINEAAQEVAIAVEAAVHSLNLGEKPQIVLAGGLFDNFPEYFDLVAEQVRLFMPNAEIINPILPPLAGAIIYALAECDIPLDNEIIDNLARGLNSLELYHYDSEEE